MDANALPNGNLTRRSFLRALLAVGAAAGAGAARGAIVGKTTRIGMTPAFVHDQHTLLADWRLYLERMLATPVEFVQRDSYRETMDLLRLGKLEFAWLCDYPFVHLKKLVRLLAVPLNQDRPYYRSYLIVGADRPRVASMADLRNSVFAFADPYSNTGYLAPRYRVREMGEDPATFFRQTFFTWSHRKVVDAVARGFADGGAVDSFVWDTLDKLRPEMTRRTRIVERSAEFGFPPFAAHRSVGNEDFARMQKVLLGMSGNPEGRALLQRLNLTGFIVGTPALYDDVARMMRVFGEE